MAIEVFNRYEKKYFVHGDQLNRVLDVIEQHMLYDKFNQGRQTYTICNIYFDTPDDFLIRTSLAKPEYKEKLRIRTYGTPERDGRAFMEIKKKVSGLVNKRRTEIGLQDGYRFVQNGGKTPYSDNMNPQVLKELSLMVRKYDLSPKVMIAYDRLAYFEKGNPDLRISFDTNIRTRRHNLKLENGSYGVKLLPESIWLMEIKTSKAMPLWLTRLLSEEELRCVSFSKYGAEYKRYIKNRKNQYSGQLSAQPFGLPPVGYSDPRQIQVKIDEGRPEYA